jgi:hypothetical protein
MGRKRGVGERSSKGEGKGGGKGRIKRGMSTYLVSTGIADRDRM